MNKKLIGPYVLRQEGNLAFIVEENLELDGVAGRVAQSVARWRYAGYTQVKEGAYLFTDGKRSFALKVFNANNKLVTQEVLDYFEEKIKIKEGRK
jgi:hypothetical protein